MTSVLNPAPQAGASGPQLSWARLNVLKEEQARWIPGMEHYRDMKSLRDGRALRREKRGLLLLLSSKESHSLRLRGKTFLFMLNFTVSMLFLLLM